MEAIALKDITSVQGSVIVHQKHVARFHGQRRNVFFTGTFDFVAVFQRQRFHRVSVEHFGHTDFRDTAGTTNTEFPSVVVGIAKPDRKASDRVSVDWGLGRFDGLRFEREREK